MSTETLDMTESLLKTFLDDERFWPAEPQTLEDTGLSTVLLESLICKNLAITGTASGRALADRICLPFRLLEDIYAAMRTRKIVMHAGAAPFNDYYYGLTESGLESARRYQQACAYTGAAPVPFVQYVNSVEAQCISTESPTDEDLREACAGISVDEKLFDLIGPAVNSGGGMFLFGSPGNGKSTIAKRLTACFGQEMWIPRAIVEDDQLIKLFDSAYHQERPESAGKLIKASDYDRRWVRIRRPTVTVGGELTMESLEMRHDPTSNTSEAPLQLKSNGGCLLIDDFGRQRINPAELLNRWIIPLECGHDFLTLSTGRKIQVPFEQLIIFSTNLEPRDLVDEAFLRRIPYKIEIGDPSEEEFYRIFELAAKQYECGYRPDSVRYLLETYYRKAGRALRRCHPRDLLKQIRNYCRYRRLPIEMRPEYIDRVAGSYFTVIFGDEDK
jgi:predicted ATPase with chaperone activity